MRYYDAGMLSLANPANSKNIFQAVGEGLMSFRDFMAKQKDDELNFGIKELVKRKNESDLNVALQTEDARVQSEIEKAIARKVERQNAELNFGLNKKYGEEEKKSAINEVKSRTNDNNANAYFVNIKTQAAKNQLTKEQNFDNLINHINSIGFIPSGDNDSDFDALSKALKSKLAQTDDVDARKKLLSALVTINTQKQNLFDSWNNNLQQDISGFKLGQMVKTQKEFSKLMTELGIKTPQELDTLELENKNMLEQIKNNPNLFQNIDVDNAIKKLEQDQAKINQTKKYFESIYEQKTKEDNNEKAVDKDLQKNIEKIGKFDNLKNTIADMKRLVINEGNFFNTGVWSNINPYEVFRQAGLSDKATSREKMQVMKNQILAQYGDFLGSSKLKAAFEASLSVMVDDIDTFGQSKTKIINQLEKLERVLNNERVTALNSMPEEHLKFYADIPNRQKRYPEIYGSSSENQAKDIYDMTFGTD